MVTVPLLRVRVDWVAAQITDRSRYRTPSRPLLLAHDARLRRFSALMRRQWACNEREIPIAQFTSPSDRTSVSFEAILKVRELHQSGSEQVGPDDPVEIRLRSRFGECVLQDLRRPAPLRQMLPGRCSELRRTLSKPQHHQVELGKSIRDG